MILFTSLLALALVDSVNPSALVVTLVLLARPRPMRTVPIYVGAIAATYFSLGALALLGVASFRETIGAALESPLGLFAQAVAGVLLLVWSLRTPRKTEPAAPVEPRSAANAMALVALGVTVTVLELPTAVPYLAAIALLAGAELPASQWVPLLGAYNLVFVAPPLLLLALHRCMGERIASRFTDLRARLERGARETARWIAGFVGGVIALTSVIELVARAR